MKSLPRLASVLLATSVLLACATTDAQDQDREGVDVGKTSVLSKLVPADDIEKAASLQYNQLLQKATSQKALVPSNDPQAQRLTAIVRRLIPFSATWNPRAKDWHWEVSLINSKQVNAFCMPGGKIAFYTGLIDQLKATDDEIAVVMGHEMAHALREHARAQMGKNTATNLGINIASQVFGWGQLGQTVAGYGSQLLSLRFSRGDETEADLVGLELAARAGFNPRAAVTLWQKMAAQEKSKPLSWLSTHPANDDRIAEIEENLPRVMPLYERAKGSAKP